MNVFFATETFSGPVEVFSPTMRMPASRPASVKVLPSAGFDSVAVSPMRMVELSEPSCTTLMPQLPTLAVPPGSL